MTAVDVFNPPAEVVNMLNPQAVRDHLRACGLVEVDEYPDANYTAWKLPGCHACETTTRRDWFDVGGGDPRWRERVIETIAVHSDESPQEVLASLLGTVRDVVPAGCSRDFAVKARAAWDAWLARDARERKDVDA